MVAINASGSVLPPPIILAGKKSTDHSDTVTDQATSISHDNAEQQGIYTTRNTTIRTTTDWSKGYIRALIHVLR